jgi:hypothetical protein
MVKEFKLVETENGYEIYKGDDVYITPLLTRIIIKDKGLAEAALRKFNFNRPMAVKRYLGRFDYDKLVGLIEEHIALEKRLNRGVYDINNWYEDIITILRARHFFDGVKLRKILDAYTEHGTMGLVLGFGLLYDLYEEYDPLLSNYAIDPEDDYVDLMIEQLGECLFDDDEEITLDESYIKDIFEKYAYTLLSKSKLTAKRFYKYLYGDGETAGILQ